MTEEELLIDCLRRLEGSGIGYMLVGSMAGNYWGVPRSTHDIDFVSLKASTVRILVGEFEGGGAHTNLGDDSTLG